MNLQEFVSETLQQVVNATLDAQQALGDKARVNPQVRPTDGMKLTHVSDWNPVHTIEFDVALSATDKEGGRKGAGLAVVGLVIGGQRHSEAIEHTVSRVRFSVNLQIGPPKSPRQD